MGKSVPATLFSATHEIPYEEIVSAVNTRGVTQVSLIGYSHGGGAIAQLAGMMIDRAQILRPYQLVFTSYIDAINNSMVADFTEENERPRGSQFHLNQYQRTLGIRGCQATRISKSIERHMAWTMLQLTTTPLC